MRILIVGVALLEHNELGLCPDCEGHKPVLIDCQPVDGKKNLGWSFDVRGSPSATPDMWREITSTSWELSRTEPPEGSKETPGKYPGMESAGL